MFCAPLLFFMCSQGNSDDLTMCNLLGSFLVEPFGGELLSPAARTLGSNIHVARGLIKIPRKVVFLINSGASRRIPLALCAVGAVVTI